MSADATSSDRVLSLLLSVLMVLSVVGIGGAAFAGSAAAQEAGNGEVILLDENGDEVDTYDSGSPLQDAYDAAAENHTILVGSGTFSAPDPQKDGLTIEGAGMDETTLETNQMNPDATDLTISDLEVDASGAAIMVEDDMAADGLHIENVRVTSSDGTTTIAFQTVAKEDNVDKADGLHIENFVADNPSVKGLYLERAHNALLSDITVDGVQYTGDESPPSNGIDINLKYDDYENLTIKDTVVRGVEADDFDEDPTWNAAIAVKARDDGDYSSPAATLTGLSIDNVTVEESVAGLRFGEPGVDYSGDIEGPTDVTITDSTFQDNENYHLEDLSDSVDLATVQDNNNDFAGSTIESDVGIYTSIQAAVDTADSGDTISVGPGTYEESVSIGTPNVTLESTDGADETTINATDDGSPAVQVSESNVTIDGFTIANDGGTGIDIENGETETDGYNPAGHEGLVVSNNIITGTDTGILSPGVPGAGEPGVSGSGGYDWSALPTYTDNEFDDNADAIELSAEAGHPLGVVESNDFDDNDNAVYVSTAFTTTVDSVSVNDNNINESNSAGIEIATGEDYDILETVDATNNWWGAASGPSGSGVAVSSNVEYAPWLDAPDGDETQAATIDGDAYATIQAAIDDASDGDTVIVEDGTYNESVTVDTPNVTLTAADGATPTVRYAPDSSTGQATIALPANNTTVSGLDVVRIGADDRTADMTGAFTQGIRVSASNVTISDNNVTGEDFPDQVNKGIMVLDDESGETGETVTNVDIVDNNVTGFYGGVSIGTSYGGTVTDVAVDGNTLDGNDNGAFVFSTDSSLSPDGVTVAHNTFANSTTAQVFVSTGASQQLANVTGEVTVGANKYDQEVRVEDVRSVYASVQSGLDAADSEDTILVEDGTYDESFDVTTNNVTLDSTAGAENTTLDIGDDPINVNADNVTLHGFSVVFESQGIYTGNDNVSVANSTFELAEGAESTDYGIRFEGSSSDGLVYNNEFVGINNTVEGEFGNGVVVAGPDDHVIVQNTFTNNSIGVNVGNNQPAADLRIANNTFTEQGSAAIALNHDASGSPKFDIVDNRIESNSVGILALSGGEINVNRNDIVDNGVAIQSTTMIDATFNWWGTESGPTADAVQGDVVTNPYLTIPSSEAADTPETITEFGFTVEMDAGAHAFGVPGPVEGTVGSIFNDFNGTVYAYADGSWTQVKNADRELSALDALVVIPDEGETARASIEIAEGSGAAAPSSKSLDEGWNFVGAPQEGAIETAYGAASANPGRAVNLYDAPTVGGSSPEGDWTKYTFGTETDGPSVSPVSGYWVYAEEDGSVAANVPAGVTFEEFGELTENPE